MTSSCYSYKAKLLGTKPFDKDYLAQSSCVLPISVGPSALSGAKLLSVIEMLNSRFESADFILADRLQRYNFSMEVSHAVQEGDRWLENNQGYLKKLQLPSELIRWADCLCDPDFKCCWEHLRTLSEDNPAYKHYLEKDVDVLMRRLSQRYQAINAVQCRCYLIEEAAVLFSFFLRQSYNFILYPGCMPSSIAFLMENLFGDKIGGLLYPLKIYFKKQRYRVPEPIFKVKLPHPQM